MSVNPVRANRLPMLALMGLMPWPATVTADRLLFDGKICWP